MITNHQLKVTGLALVLGIAFSWFMILTASHAGSELRNSLEAYSAAVNDSGYNSHKQLHIEQEHTLRIDKYNLKKGFGE